MSRDDYAVRHSEILPHGLKRGSKVIFSGQLDAELIRFSINLCKDKDMKEIPLHFNPRFAENRVVRNTKALCGWGDEEWWGPPFPFTKGQVFMIEILCLDDKFEIEVDGKFFVQYAYRGPLSDIKYLHVNGGVSVLNVSVS